MEGRTPLSDTPKLMSAAEMESKSQADSHPRSRHPSRQGGSIHKRMSRLEDMVEKRLSHQEAMLEAIKGRSENTAKYLSGLLEMIDNTSDEDNLTECEKQLREIEQKIQQSEMQGETTVEDKTTAAQQQESQQQERKKMPTWMKVSIGTLASAVSLGGAFKLGKTIGVRQTAKQMGLDEEG